MKDLHKDLAFPISDTIPGPGNFKAEVECTSSHGSREIPTVKTKEPVGHLGHGTAEDIPSTDLTPDPFES